MDFASTHHSVAGMAPWLPTKRHHNAGGPTNTLGEQRPRNGGIISPAVSEPGGEFVWGGADSMNPLLALYTGHGLGADGRRRKMATAHRLATKVAAQSGNSLSFELLFMHIVKVSYFPTTLPVLEFLTLLVSSFCYELVGSDLWSYFEYAPTGSNIIFPALALKPVHSSHQDLVWGGGVRVVL